MWSYSHGYQVADTEATFALGSPGTYGEGIYTAASRHKHTLRFYLADPTSSANPANSTAPAASARTPSSASSPTLNAATPTTPRSTGHNAPRSRNSRPTGCTPKRNASNSCSPRHPGRGYSASSPTPKRTWPLPNAPLPAPPSAAGHSNASPAVVGGAAAKSSTS
jgi:hypothetical protein